jgi:predicted  nucleic acid-binding Zn-ribbon protein
MNRAQALYELQLVDSALDERLERLRAVERQLGESEILRQARVTKQQAAERVASLEQQVRDLAWQVQDLDAAIAKIDQKLYGGTVRNPKELTDLSRDLESHQKRKRQLEDAELALMLDLEEAQRALDQAATALAQTEAAWQTEQAHLVAARDALRAEIDQLTGRRERVLQFVVEPDRVLYEQLRLRGRGLAVARVTRNLCGACRIALSAAELHRVRTSAVPVTCSSCGRVLYAG